MLRRKQSKAYRFVAAFLALLMLASLIPVSHAGLVQAADILESYTVTLTDGSQDGEGNYIPLTQEGAEVTLTDPALQEAEPLSASTDANGVATFANCVEDGKTYQLSVTGVNGYEDLVSTNVTPALNDINYYAVLTPAQPQPVTTTISGTVNGSDGQGYSGAQVSLFEGTIEESEAALFTTDTDASGGYTFPNVDISKSYTIRVEPKEEDPQYKTGEISITGLTAEPYTTSTLTLEKEQFSIAVDPVENGSVTVNGSGAPFLVDYGEDAEIKVEAATGYRIGTLTVNGNEIQEAAGEQDYTYTISPVTEAHKVSVTFLRQTYTITFSVDENGKVEYADGKVEDADGIEAIDGGSVSFDESTDPPNSTLVKITATANDNYRVSEVKIDGTSVNEDDNPENNLEVANDGGYETVLEMTKDYTFSVTFELNKYEISVAEGVENGTVAVDSASSEVEHGSPVTLTLTPNPDYTIQSVVINQQSHLVTALPEGVTLELKQGDTYALELTVANVSEKMEIGAVFESIPSISWADAKMSISETEGMIKEDTAEGSNWIYPYNSTVTISTGLTGIVVGDYSAPVQSTWTTAESIPLNSQTIQVLDGVVLKQVTVDPPIQIIIDKEKPEVTNVQSTADSWTNQAVTVTVTAADEGNFASGVARVVYNTEQTVEGAQEAQQNQDGTYFFTLDSEQNATYYIYAVDRSGNVSDAAQTVVQIDKTDPQITGFSFSSQEDAAVSDEIYDRQFGIYSADSIYVTVTAGDDDSSVSSGVASITLYKGDTIIETLNTVNGSATFELNADEFAGGAEITAIATDVAGSASDQKGPADTGSALSNFVQINATAPTVTIVPDDPGYTAENGAKWYGGDTKFTVTISDENVGIQDVQILLNKQDITSLIVKEDFTAQEVSSVDYIIDTSVIEQVAQRPEDGSYTLEVTATNNAGVPYDENPETEDKEPATDTVYLDVAAPNMKGVTIETYQGSVWEQVADFLTFGIFHNDKIQITVTASDVAPSAGLATATLYRQNNSGEWEQLGDSASVTDEGTFVFVVPVDEVGSEEDVYFNEELAVKVKDAVGHSDGPTRLSAISNEDSIDSDTVLIETVAPVIGEITVESTEPNAVVKGQEWYHDVIYFTIPISDSDSGINNYQITINDEVVADWQLPEDGSQVFSETVSVNTTGIQAKEDGSYVLEVAVEDNAGNTNTDEKPVYYETAQPILTNISRSPENPAYQNENDGKNWYDGDIEYTLSIADQLIGEENKVYSGLNHVSITINDTNCYSWNATEGAAKVGELNDISIRTQDIAPTEEGAYNLVVTFRDNAGNENTYTETVYKDIDAPYISNITFTPITDNSDGALNNTPVETEYGYYFTTDTQVTIQALDDNGPSSGINTITYYLDDVEDDSEPTYVEEQVDSNGTITFTIPANFKGQIYAKATDNVGNTPTEGGADGKGYVTPDGVILETQDKHDQENHITFTKEDTPYRDANGLELYGSDVPVNITITDTYSGIRRVEWSVTAPYDTANNQSGVVDVENNGDLSQDGWITDQENNLVTAMNTTINVSNDSNGIVLSVTMTDRAGNTSTQSIQFSVDKTAPAIDVVYDNNSPDVTYTDIYQADRTATITVTERNFNAADIQTAITNTDGVIPTLTGWEEHWNATDPNASYYVAHVSYTADGDYTFDIGYTDRAGHTAAAVPQHRFTIDKTIPTLSVSYNNNDVVNGNYYSAQRTATITIVEHNFDPTRVTVLGTATDNGAASVFPTLSGWTTQGDTHTATLLYAADGLYTFDIEFNDMAGNAIADFAPQTFYVDQTDPTIEEIAGIPKFANNGTVAPVLTFYDTNFNPDAVSITLSGVNNGTVNYVGAYQEIANGRRFTYADFEHTKQVDDIYTLTVTLTDLAGNDATRSFTFSVNRFGSTYDLTDLAELNGKFIQSEEDIIFEEINVDALNQDTIRIVMTKNGTPVDLVEGTDYTVEVTGGNGQWSVYRYIINRSLFADDGRYTISVYSVDSAGNINENIDEAKQAEISFGVDKTAPVIVPLDLDNGAQYPVQVKDTTVEIRDNLVLENVTIYLNDQAVEYQENEESYQFSIPETNSLQDVRIVAEDAAGNRQEVTVADFLVSTNFFVRWYNNTPLFIGTIAGVVVIALGITAFLVFGRRKKKDEEQEEG